jgi:hypothetical protein
MSKSGEESATSRSSKNRICFFRCDTCGKALFSMPIKRWTCPFLFYRQLICYVILWCRMLVPTGDLLPAFSSRSSKPQNTSVVALRQTHFDSLWTAYLWRWDQNVVLERPYRTIILGCLKHKREQILFKSRRNPEIMHLSLLVTGRNIWEFRFSPIIWEP